MARKFNFSFSPLSASPKKEKDVCGIKHNGANSFEALCYRANVVEHRKISWGTNLPKKCTRILNAIHLKWQEVQEMLK